MPSGEAPCLLITTAFAPHAIPAKTGVQSSRLTFNPLAPILGERRRPEGHPQTPGGKHAAPLLRQPPCITLTDTLGLNRTPDFPQTDDWHVVLLCS